MESEAVYYLLRYEALRDEYGAMSHYVEEIRDLINQAALHDQLTGVHRDELLEIVEHIDSKRRALDGDADQRS